MRRSLEQQPANGHLSCQDSLRGLLAPYVAKPVMVHSDLFGASPFVARTTERERALASHRDFLGSLQVRLKVAAFNYQFPRRLETDLRTAPVEIGPLGDFMRCHWATERTFDPVFSFLIGDEQSLSPPPEDGLFIAFGERSLFPQVAAEGGAVLMYGATVKSLTMMHFAELLAGGPLYRYDKEFAGPVIDWHGRTVTACYRYHVRPLGRHLAYDWVRIQAMLVDAGVLQWISPERESLGFLLDARMLVETLTAALKDDPLCLLDSESRGWVGAEIQRLGRRFVVTDFEPVAVR